MSARPAFAVGSLTAATLVACAYANGYDPARYANPPPAASVDPEIEPLVPSPKRLIRDPRGPYVARSTPDASVTALTDAAVDADADTAVRVATIVPAAVADASTVEATCGSKADPCPMQRFMHGALATAHTPETLTAAFTRLAGMSPDPAWSWTAIATRGANLANAGDVVGSKVQCAACHDAYRDVYRSLYRSRKF